MKKALIGLIALLALLFAAYKILSGITRVSINKTTNLAPPSSAKSQPEYYAFGYQPDLKYTEDRPSWSKAQCDALPPDQRPESCDNNQADKIVEMAWSSPIWFTPGLTQDLLTDIETQPENNSDHEH